MSAIDGNKLVLFIVEPVPWQHLVGMRNRDSFEAGVVEYPVASSFGAALFAEEPIVIQAESRAGVILVRSAR